ncbi:MAG: METTL5 family protein [Promethearchaeota archaeon]
MKINKKDLTSIIQNTKTFDKPKVKLEQYCIDANSAVDLIYYAGFEFDDIKNSLVIDLGAGTGRLSIASALFNATLVLSIDIDVEALTILKDNICSLELEHLIHPICSDINFFTLSKRLLPPNLKATTIMNPPFGVQTRSADRIFLEKAFSFSDVIYSIHLAGEKIQKFISNYVQKFDWIIDNILPFNLILERSFPFHSQETKLIDVNVYRFIKKK